MGQYFYDNLSFNVSLMSLLGFLLLFKIASILPLIRAKKSIILLSQATFGVYLIHPFIIDLLNHYANMNIHQMPSALWFFISVKIGVVYFVSLICILILRKMPFVKMAVGEV